MSGAYTGSQVQFIVDLPTPSGALTCGDEMTGAYYGVQVQFIVNLPFTNVDLSFDATQSQFNLLEIQLFLADGNVFVGSDADGDGVLTQSNLPVGNYKFILHGDGTPGSFDVRVRCVTKSPTPSPTETTPSPTETTPSPTENPTPAPTIDPTTKHPTESRIVTVSVSFPGNGHPLSDTTLLEDPYGGFTSFIEV
eukprot:384578_1